MGFSFILLPCKLYLGVKLPVRVTPSFVTLQAALELTPEIGNTPTPSLEIRSLEPEIKKGSVIVVYCTKLLSVTRVISSLPFSLLSRVIIMSFCKEYNHLAATEFHQRCVHSYFPVHLYLLESIYTTLCKKWNHSVDSTPHINIKFSFI